MWQDENIMKDGNNQSSGQRRKWSTHLHTRGEVYYNVLNHLRLRVNLAQSLSQLRILSYSLKKREFNAPIQNMNGVTSPLSICGNDQTKTRDQSIY